MHRLVQLLIVAGLIVGLVACEERKRGASATPGDGEGTPEAPATPEAGSEPEAPAVVNVAGPATATIKGMVKLTVEPPAMKKIDMSGNKDCAKFNEGKPDPLFEQVVAGENGALQNVIVHVTKGLEGRTFDPPEDGVVLDQEGCKYSPHVFAVQAKQKFEIKNSDPTLHNVNIQPSKNPRLNKGMPNVGSFEHSFRKAEPDPVRIVCDVHSWMNAWVGVYDHPYFDVTRDQGAFELPKISAGTYTVTAWHEKYGEVSQQVTIADGETKEITFEFGKK